MNLICRLQCFDMDIGGLQHVRHRFLFIVSYLQREQFCRHKNCVYSLKAKLWETFSGSAKLPSNKLINSALLTSY